jgi:aspartyl/asparaginyl beta-hydroxylase (cupin superfamily)
MNDVQGTTRELMTRAAEARQAGRPAEASDLLQRMLAANPRAAPGWNLLGIIQLENGGVTEAAASFRTAVEIDPAPPVWLNLAKAQRALGDHAAEMRAIDAALARDAYFVPAIFAKGLALRSAGREPEAVQLYRLLLEGIDSLPEVPAALADQLSEARAFLASVGDRRFENFKEALSQVATRFPDADLSRASAYAQALAGKRKVFQQQPTGPHFPYLPAIEFFDAGLFPWFQELERSTQEMRDEILSLWAEEGAEFRPYVAYAPGTPVNQWTELNHSTRWSAWFFWEDGRRNEVACARCPRTAAAIEKVPMLDIPGKSPTAMFSILQPRTRIPAHTGTTNARVTVHLPLVVPPGCGFRVGADTREWREGVCWAFDDTIEHEAWNDSDQPRAILIIDAWNPLLSEAERAAVRALG